MIARAVIVPMHGNNDLLQTMAMLKTRGIDVVLLEPHADEMTRAVREYERVRTLVPACFSEGVFA